MNKIKPFVETITVEKRENDSPALILHYKGQGEKTALRFDEETPLGEPQMWLDLYDGTYLELTHEEEGLRKEEQFYSLRLHCTDANLENGFYEETCGVMQQYAGRSLDELLEKMKEIINGGKK